ncbi:MAG TPA: hypothetical protein VG737_14275 [Cyclobacteriaceae bacterium]|nr:hypothetical protein [Cyclobacteriaceae bacterium]
MKSIFIIALVFVAFVAAAQTRPEFSINLSENGIVLKPGESKQVGISIVRSKGFTKGDVSLSLSNALPAGITVNYEPAVGHFDTSTATITASTTAAAGSYQLVLNATIHNKVKGTILKVVVGNEGMASK